MAIEIKTRAKSRETSPLLIIGVIVCLLVVVGVVGPFIYFYLDINKTKEAIAEKEVKALEINQIILEREGELLLMKNKIEQYSDIISNHNSPLNVFTFLEENCLPKVWFSNFQFDVEGKTAILSGHTESFGTLEQQADQLRIQPELVSLDITSVILDEDEEIEFKFSLVFNPSILIPQINFEEEVEIEQ
jgi:hypothetical protein